MISDEVYRVISNDDVDTFRNKDWFKLSAIPIDERSFMVPEKYLTQFLSNREVSRSKLRELINDFDFNKVHTIMETLGWTWAGLDRVPTVTEMIDKVTTMYKTIEPRVLQGESAGIATGGFSLTYSIAGELSLIFEAVTSSVYYDN